MPPEGYEAAELNGRAHGGTRGTGSEAGPMVRTQGQCHAGPAAGEPRSVVPVALTAQPAHTKVGVPAVKLGVMELQRARQ
jgi:hypothetical protein